jgi:nucleoside-diphosphate-sugar epimerase
MKHSKYSMVNWFIRQAMEDKLIRIFGDGQQVRDYIFVEDLADAFLRAAVDAKSVGEIFNVGSGVGIRFRDMVETILQIVGSGKADYVPWPTDYINVETGDYVTDIAKICQALKWKPQTSFAAGIQQTYAFYQENRAKYW